MNSSRKGERAHSPAVGKLESMCSDFDGGCWSRLHLEWCACVIRIVCSVSCGCYYNGTFFRCFCSLM